MEGEKIDWDNIDQSQDETTPETTPERIDDLLSDYKEAANVIPDSLDNEPIKQADNNESNLVDGIDKRYYYVSGKKKGQPRKKPLVRYEPEKDITVLSSTFLTGAFLLTMADLILPAILVGLNNWLSKDKLKLDNIIMSDTQRTQLIPIADAYLKAVKVDANPLTVLIVSFIGIYGVNFLTAKMK